MNARRLLSGLALAMLAPFLFLVPAQAADDPIPGDQTDPCGIVWRDREIAFWRQTAADQREEATARELAVLGRALLAEDRVATLTADVAARTAERDRAELRASRQTRAIIRLQAKVAELRARLRQTPVG